jgi:hypothetical protein
VGRYRTLGQESITEDGPLECQGRVERRAQPREVPRRRDPGRLRGKEKEGSQRGQSEAEGQQSQVTYSNLNDFSRFQCTGSGIFLPPKTGKLFRTYPTSASTKSMSLYKYVVLRYIVFSENGG